MKKIVKLLALTSLLSLSTTSPAFAGTWEQDTKGWWWQDEDKTFPSSTWKWIDSDGDGLAECYYFDENGYLLTGTLTPDGFSVNESGAWTDHGIVRKKAANPFAARTMNQRGLELYQEADQKSSGLPGQDIQGDVHMNLLYDEFEIPISMNIQLKYHDINSSNMEFYAFTDTNMMGLQGLESSFYTNGCFYSDMGENAKFKMRIGYEDMTRNLTLGGLTGQFGAFLENVQIENDEAGNRILLYSSETKGLENHLLNFYDKVWPSLADFSINRLVGKAIITPEGYFSKEAIWISMTLTEDGETMDMYVNFDLDYHNPGKDVAIQFPSLEGFEELIY